MPARAEIKKKVKGVLSRASGVPVAKIQEEESLRRDLDLTNIAIKSLAIPYTKISTSYPKGLRIKRVTAASLKTVKASIDLVHKRSEGED